MNLSRFDLHSKPCLLASQSLKIPFGAFTHNRKSKSFDLYLTVNKPKKSKSMAIGCNLMLAFVLFLEITEGI